MSNNQHLDTPGSLSQTFEQCIVQLSSKFKPLLFPSGTPPETLPKNWLFHAHTMGNTEKTKESMIKCATVPQTDCGEQLSKTKHNQMCIFSQHTLKTWYLWITSHSNPLFARPRMYI